MFIRSLIFTLAFSAGASVASADSWNVYVGTYTGGESEGIYRLRFDDETGKTTLEGLAGKAENPNFLALHPSKPVLYAVCRMDGGDAVASF